VAPGFIETDMTAELSETARAEILARVPLGAMGSPEDVAEAVRWLAVSAPYVHGAVLHVNGGLHG
jgi:3-oxoacyl-[acyl-carrier protein] reductase